MSSKKNLSKIKPTNLAEDELLDQVPEIDNPNPKRKNRTLRHDLLRVVFIVGLFAIVMVSLKNEFVRDFFNSDIMRERLQNDDTLAGRFSSYLGFLAVTTIFIGLGLPRSVVSTLAGTIYGAFIGTLLALGSSLLGSLITYYLGKSILRGVAKRRLSKHFTVWDARLKENAFWWVLIARLAPFINGQLMNLLFGALRCPLKPFLLASIIGLLPLTLVFALLGSGAAKGDGNQLLYGGLLFLVVNLIYFLRRPKSTNKAAT